MRPKPFIQTFFIVRIIDSERVDLSNFAGTFGLLVCPFIDRPPLESVFQWFCHKGIAIATGQIWNAFQEALSRVPDYPE
jgi:hypothetical protein